MKSFEWLLAVVCVCIALSSPALASEPDPRADAHARFERGLQLYRDGDHAGALAEFAHVHEALPDEYVLFNIGLVYAAMNRPVEAKDALDRLLQSPGRLSPDRLAQASRTRDAQARRVARLAVTTNVAAVIEIDGLEVARTPLASPLAIASGMHVVTARAAGHTSSTREVIAAGEVETQLALLLEPLPPARAELVVDGALPAQVSIGGVPVGLTPLAASLPGPPDRLLAELRRQQIAETNSEERWAWIATGSGVALALAGAGLAVWGQATLPDLRNQLAVAQRDNERMSGSECDRAVAPPLGMGRRRLRNKCVARVSTLQDDVSQRETWRTVGTIVGGAGLALSALGVYLLATQSDPERLEPRPTVAAQPWVGWGEAGASFSLQD